MGRENDFTFGRAQLGGSEFEQFERGVTEGRGSRREKTVRL